jgi:hypothetical protein
MMAPFSESNASVLFSVCYLFMKSLAIDLRSCTFSTVLDYFTRDCRIFFRTRLGNALNRSSDGTGKTQLK